jgi:ribosome-binding protein aMBF1 (putative translation factor)
MGDIEDYIQNRMERDLEYSRDYETGYEGFKIGLIIKELRLRSGLTQEELAGKMRVKKGAISRMENSAADVRLSSLMKAAEICGKRLRMTIE